MKGSLAMKNLSFLFAMCAVLVSSACSDNEPVDARGATSATQCPALGSSCAGILELYDCGSVCRCGYWVTLGSQQAAQQCPSQQPPSTCYVDMGCSGEGSYCSGKQGNLTCHCGRWENPALASYSCTPAQQNPGAGGSGGSQAVPYPTEGPTRVVDIYITSPHKLSHVWCEGAEVMKNDHRPDQQAQWAAGAPGVWHSFGCDALNGESYHCRIETSVANSFRHQCYLNTAGTATSGDLVRYTCANPRQLYTDEQFLENPQAGPPVDNLNGSYNCQID